MDVQEKRRVTRSKRARQSRRRLVGGIDLLGFRKGADDLLRERVSNNIGEAGDEQISRMAVTQHIVVTISADTPIYVVLEQTPKANLTWAQSGLRSTQPSRPANVEELRQLLQLQRELNQSSTSNQ